MANEKITNIVEEIKTLAYGDHLVIGQIKTCIEHPDSDHLHVLNVDIGNEVLQIVCGASNVRVGLITALATIGAKVGEIEISKADSKVKVYVVPTNEELMIAKDTYEIVKGL